jgi:hypothetical protein
MQTHQGDDPLHEGVVTDLLDLQARLRGEPATVVWPRVDAAREEHASRIEALRRRLASLELEIEAYEHSVGRAPRPAPRDAVVLPFRRRRQPQDAD